MTTVDGMANGLMVVLVFIGSKIIVADMLGIAKVPPAISLGATFAILITGILYSLWKTRGQASPPLTPAEVTATLKD